MPTGVPPSLEHLWGEGPGLAPNKILAVPLRFSEALRETEEGDGPRMVQTVVTKVTYYNADRSDSYVLYPRPERDTPTEVKSIPINMLPLLL
jgi:hypothetical protein